MADVSGVQGSTETGGTDAASGSSQPGGESSKDASTVTFSSLAELREKDPELYNEFNKLLMQGMAQEICDDSKKAQEKIKKIRLEAERR